MTYANEQKSLITPTRPLRINNLQSNTITNPLYINTTWAYLYEFMDKVSNKYLPFWGGRDQNGNLRQSTLTNKPTNIRYLIIEPTTGIPDFFVKEAISAENTKSILINTQKVGNFVVQKRSLK